MGDFRVGSQVHSVRTSQVGFDTAKGKTEKFADIFGDLGISASADTFQRCQEEGIQDAKELSERELENLTNNPPLGKDIPGPSSHRG
ncbi:MAG: hypothetical protein K940chlam1_00016 [Candidatus Anoxychlamydiales bacterium]|nr:hypothetical protein [Candidatus Anoxychlamydiales bacterium]NGX36848.1 hypothetical protein [Candidatus Anoxychlamydiales bacterium]